MLGRLEGPGRSSPHNASAGSFSVFSFDKLVPGLLLALEAPMSGLKPRTEGKHKQVCECLISRQYRRHVVRPSHTSNVRAIVEDGDTDGRQRLRDLNLLEHAEFWNFHTRLLIVRDYEH